ALRESGVPENDPRLTSAVRWLVDREVRFAGDWSRIVSNIEPSGWAFEFANIYYPDTDDTAMVLLALARFPEFDGTDLQKRALKWLLAFQCKQGGWAAFDSDVTDRWLEEVPFADHNAIIDPECSDLTARVLELLGHQKRIGPIGHIGPIPPAIARAVEYLRQTQEPDGSWYGRWGVNYIYGTWQVLRGLSTLGWDMREPWLERARDWLESCQNEDGSWGETAASYTDPTTRGKGHGTASQTAWALMGLCAAHEPARSRILRGAHFLLHTQQPAGDWCEPDTTGTGFPGVFYLRYDSYRINWPLLALAEVRKFLG
ncbi:MAG TPA: prenyltransferase/squalene oxidase repeat-containing protein, partial [Chthoniobacterales bacterium]